MALCRLAFTGPSPVLLSGLLVEITALRPNLGRFDLTLPQGCVLLPRQVSETFYEDSLKGETYKYRKSWQDPSKGLPTLQHFGRYQTKMSLNPYKGSTRWCHHQIAYPFVRIPKYRRKVLMGRVEARTKELIFEAASLRK